jgi:phage terminase small subunit
VAEERLFAAAYADTGDKAFATAQSGYSGPARSVAAKVLARPMVQAEVLRIQQERLENELLPLAINCLRSIIISDKAPAGARVQAAKVVMDRTLGKDQANDGKEPHEWTAGRLAEEIDRLEQIAAARAKPVEATQLEQPKPDLFG